MSSAHSPLTREQKNYYGHCTLLTARHTQLGAHLCLLHAGRMKCRLITHLLRAPSPCSPSKPRRKDKVSPPARLIGTHVCARARAMRPPPPRSAAH
eukprot:scaffold8070_cov112-Isochrysis_galbana.AAC.1